MEISNQLISFEKELERKGYRKESIKTYLPCVSVFLNHFKQKDSAKHISEDDIKSFLSQYKTHNTQRSYHSAIKCFYKYVCRQPNKFKYIEYCKRNRRLPIVLSIDEMKSIIFAATNLKHKTILCLMYSTACRVSEVINLKVNHIDPSRMVINIIDAKGGKDRNVTLDPSFYELLKVYIEQYNPKEYLFEGQFEPFYSARSIAQFLQKYADVAGIKKKVNPHLIRHTAATHLVEAGLDMSILQKLLGHENIKTTHLYGHISNNRISGITTPLQNIVQQIPERRLIK
jgi:site-specific recombinase XerD